MSSDFHALLDVIQSEHFPAADLALRQGRHIGRDDGPVYDYLDDALPWLEPFYRRFGAEIVHRIDGYFFLLPTGNRLRRKQLDAAQMTVGQTLALLNLDPGTLRLGGRVHQEALLEQLSGLMSTKALYLRFYPHTKKYNERLAAVRVREKLATAVHQLARLGFLEEGEAGMLHLRPAVMRFAEPVRDLGDPQGALERLIAQGAVVQGAALIDDAGADELTDPEDDDLNEDHDTNLDDDREAR